MNDSTEIALEVSHLCKWFGSLRAVDDVGFQIVPGQILGFIGPNGAGKTTTMRICATLELPDSGDVRVHGLSVREDPREVRRLLGFMPDAYGVYANTPILDYLDFFARAYGLHGAARRDAIEQVMDFTSLAALSAKEISSLSKGMRQRLCLAKTLLHDPAVLILDEPAAGLDPRARVELRELVRTLAELGKAVLVSSHILTELSEMCDSVVIIEQGRVRAQGTVDAVVAEARPHLQLLVRALAEDDVVERMLLEQPRVVGVHLREKGFVVDYDGEPEQLAELLAAMVEQGLRPVEFSAQSVSLEDIFLAVTEGHVQ